MPVPRNLSSSCGTCVRFWMEQEFSEVSLELNEELEQIVQVEGDSYRALYRSEE